MDKFIPYIPMDRRHALVAGQNLPEETSGTALFADISGFTPLTDRLVAKLGRQQAVEILTKQLNQVYNALIAQVHHYRGSVIGFVGDAITCWFDRDEGLRAAACALMMQQAMQPFKAIPLSDGETMALSIKIGLASGPARRFLVGQADIQYLDVLAGKTLINMALAEKQARQGEIVLHQSTRQALGNAVSATPPTTETDYAILNGLNATVQANPWPPLKTEHFTENMVKPWLIEPVFKQLQSGSDQFLAELRPATALFLKFNNLDFDNDSQAGQKLNAFIIWVQKTAGQYGGYLIQLTIGDRGSFMYLSFGAPVTYANNAIRAVGAALALRELPPELSSITVQMGLAEGQMRTGAYGSDNRTSYGVIGSEAILAHRLMMVAQAGQIRCDEKVYRSARQNFNFEALPAVRVKGKTELIHIYRPIAEYTQINAKQVALSQKLIGRAKEMAQFNASLERVKQGQNQILIIEGEAGLGKTRLINQFQQMARQQGLTPLFSAGQSVKQHLTYQVGHDILNIYFQLEGVENLTERQERVETRMAQVAPQFVERLPLLNDVLNLNFPETELTASLEPALRRQSLISMLVSLLESIAVVRPLIVIIEDAHWLDSPSWVLILQITRALQARQVPFLLLVSTRPEGQTVRPEFLALSAMKQAVHINLQRLNQTEISALIAARLGLSPSAAPPEVVQFISQRAEGNPFYAEELVNTLREQGLIILESAPDQPDSAHQYRCVIQGDLNQAGQDLPNTLQGLILARIDRLPPTQQLTLKIAAVIGRKFAYAPLSYVLNHYAPTDDITLKTRLEALAALDLAYPETLEPEPLYSFKHIITQEVSYQTLLFSQRRQLHQLVAQWYEQTFAQIDKPLDETSNEIPPGLVPFLPLLVYHYHQAQITDKERRYAKLAGYQALAEYANDEALAHFNRALALTPDTNLSERYNLLLAREEVYHLQGKRDEQAQDLASLQALGQTLADESLETNIYLRRARYAEAIADYPAVISAVKRAISLAQKNRQPALEAKGYYYWGHALMRQGVYSEATDILNKTLSLAQSGQLPLIEIDSWRVLGFIAYAQGNYTQAIDYQHKALALSGQEKNRQRQGLALNNLGNIYLNINQYAKGEGYYRQALEHFKTVGDKRRQGIVALNMGAFMGEQKLYSQALDYYHQALPIFAEIEDRKSGAITLNNLGYILEQLGAYQQAKTLYEQSIEVSREIGNPEGETETLANLSLLYYHVDDMENAQAYAQKALDISRQIGDRRNIAYCVNHQAHIYAKQGALAQALKMYQQAYQLRQTLGQTALAIESLAGIAHTLLRQGLLTEAQTQAETVWSYLQNNPLNGTDEPFQIYLSCYKVMQANNKAIAAAILEAGYQALQNLAQKITDPALAHSYLENVAANKALVLLWKAKRG